MKKSNSEKSKDKISLHEENFMQHIRDRILKYMSDNNLTIQGLSEMTDIPFSTFNSLLYKSANDCKTSNTVKFCKATGISLDELLNVGTISKDEQHMLNAYRLLNDRGKYVINWVIDRELGNYHEIESDKQIPVLTPTIDEYGNLKPSKDFELCDITNVPSSVRAKIFTAFRLSCDYYMPNYTPMDILLIANDRPARMSETCIIEYGGSYFLAKRRIDKGVAKYYSIRDGKFRVRESQVDRNIGYIAYVL